MHLNWFLLLRVVQWYLPFYFSVLPYIFFLLSECLCYRMHLIQFMFLLFLVMALSFCITLWVSRLVLSLYQFWNLFLCHSCIVLSTIYFVVQCLLFFQYGVHVVVLIHMAVFVMCVQLTRIFVFASAHFCEMTMLAAFSAVFVTFVMWC